MDSAIDNVNRESGQVGVLEGGGNKYGKRGKGIEGLREGLRLEKVDRHDRRRKGKKEGVNGGKIGLWLVGR